MIVSFCQGRGKGKYYSIARQLDISGFFFIATGILQSEIEELYSYMIVSFSDVSWRRREKDMYREKNRDLLIFLSCK